MVDAIGGPIEEGRVKVYAVDSFDSGSWYREELSLEERAQQHGRYEDWILNQVVPFVQADSNTARDHGHRRQLRRLSRSQLRAQARARVPARDLPERRLRRVGGRRRRARRRRLLQQPGRLRPAPRRRPPRLAPRPRQPAPDRGAGAVGGHDRARSRARGVSRSCSARRASSTSWISGATTRRTTGPRGAPRSRIISPASYEHPPSSDRPPARHRGGLAARLRAPARAGRPDRARRRDARADAPSGSRTSRSTSARSHAIRS